MNVRKFVAPTARDALRKVKELLGPDAIILSNRAIPGGVEIMAVAASEMDMIVQQPVAEPKPRQEPDYTVRLSAASRLTPQPSLLSCHPGRARSALGMTRGVDRPLKFARHGEVRAGEAAGPRTTTRNAPGDARERRTVCGRSYGLRQRCS